MFFRQVLYGDLGCASYVVGDAGEAIVIDPCWDVDLYVELARAERLQITHVLDTHEHADHVSGRVRLVRKTGACPLRAGGEPGVDGIGAGDEIAVGGLRVRALGTPGHRPEHLSFVVSDAARGADPWFVLTGDSLLVGDLARPDLVLEASAGAHELHASLRELVALGDHVEVWPAHIGGSLCGGAGLSGKTNSTIGFERCHNPMLMMDRDRFVSSLIDGLPPRPPNIDRIVELNRACTSEPEEVRNLDPDRALELLGTGVTVLDGRDPAAFDAGHIAGAVNLPAGSAGVGTRAGWSFGADEPIMIAADEESTARKMTIALQAVGLWHTVGYTLGDGSAWEQHGMPVATADSWDIARLADGLRSDSVDLVDVRDNPEWISGHVPGSHHLPLHVLASTDGWILPDRGRTTAVACAGGTRAAFAASLLRRTGRRDVVRVGDGGVADLESLGIELAVGA